jgi:hypothetical protein
MKWFLCALALAVAVTTVSAQAVEMKMGKDQVEFTIDGQAAGIYRYGKDLPKPVIWPVYAPGGQEMTRAYPLDKNREGETKDHPHHQSVWFCHGDVIPEGIEVKQKIKGIEGVDFWSINTGHGNIVCTKLKAGDSGKNWNGIVSHNEWQTADGQKILDEDRTVTLYNFGKARLWVFDVDLHASVCPITFGDTKEGAMAIRVNDAMNERGTGTMQNAEGKKKEKETWGLKSAWCDYSGTLGGEKVGIAILEDPNNAHKVCWHARGYGLMGANPFGREKARFPGVAGVKDLVRLDKGEHLRLRYGVLVHEGDTESGNVAEYYERFVKLGEKK